MVQSIAVGAIDRKSGNPDEHDIDQPPYKTITVTNIFGFKSKPLIGDKVTVLAIGSGLSPVELRIQKAQLTDDPCDESLPRWWDVELQPITQKEFFDAPAPADRSAEYPFDVAIFYPAVKTAREVKKDQLKAAMLPKGVTAGMVKAAIDLDENGTPEVVITEYCCFNKALPATACDYTCGKTYRRVGSVWKIVDTTSPC